MDEIGDVGGDFGAGPIGGTEAAEPTVAPAEKNELIAKAAAAPDAAAVNVGDRIVGGDDVFQTQHADPKQYDQDVVKLVDDISKAKPEDEPRLRKEIIDRFGKYGDIGASSYLHSRLGDVLDAPNYYANEKNAEELRGDLLRYATPGQAQSMGQLRSAAAGLGLTAGALRTPGTTAAPTRVEPLGDLRAHEISRIQAAANASRETIYVTGSAARGARRGLDTDLPLGHFGQPKAGTRSDIDYAVRPGVDDAINRLKLPDVDPSFGVRGVDYLNLKNGPIIRFSPNEGPVVIPQGSGRIMLR